MVIRDEPGAPLDLLRKVVHLLLARRSQRIGGEVRRGRFGMFAMRTTAA